VLGVYRTQSEADDRALRFAEKEKVDLAEIRVEERDFGDWDY
jgi:hypothetical protein